MISLLTIIPLLAEPSNCTPLHYFFIIFFLSKHFISILSKLEKSQTPPFILPSPLPDQLECSPGRDLDRRPRKAVQLLSRGMAGRGAPPLHALHQRQHGQAQG